MSDAQRTAQLIQEVAPDVVVHTQALSDVDRCELEPAAARAQNVEATAHLIDALQGSSAWLIYLSTDYVFDGTKGRPYDELDEPHPISVYGTSKLEGERLVLAFARGLIVRPSTLFGSARLNFCDHVAMRLRQGLSVEAFVDQTTSPTYAEDLANGIGALLAALGQSRLAGHRIFHMANAGGCTRAAFAWRIADLLGCPRQLIQVIPMASQQRPAKRPAYSALATRHLAKVIGTTLRPWEEALQTYLRQRYPVASSQTAS